MSRGWKKGKGREGWKDREGKGREREEGNVEFYHLLLSDLTTAYTTVQRHIDISLI